MKRHLYERPTSNDKVAESHLEDGGGKRKSAQSLLYSLNVVVVEIEQLKCWKCCVYRFIALSFNKTPNKHWDKFRFIENVK